MPKFGVLALQGDFREHLASLERLGQAAQIVRTPEDLKQVDALVIPGGESSVIDRLSRNYSLAEPIKERIAAGMPAYGSCAGMIMLADRIENPAVSSAGAVQQSFGGIDMTVRRNAFGRQVDSFEYQLDFNGKNLEAVFIRAPEAVQVGPEVQVISMVPAEDEREQGRIVAVRQGNLLATSFHPEVTGSTAIHEFFIQLTRGDA
ncbi:MULTISPECIES: pyridoxal 5'-phosphate synthase glutaminase subunit PdxT [Micrococcaceae]|uniref:pyridoxal 5'-phosphate synthase glutaminase subunit PdxT n=1 Tax=Micrococcaceae TaxID=1268 RepID=UPI001036667C|nr:MULTISPECIES: pyridoxal 5'-phosphate synthase glutaminase subunit PdxT [Micrococcaceae]TAP27379.1 pyridoxal 5'-phosphate synthase glutaminase subunit PdxT [Arthrobacter sp. S41]UXN30954.1 pyridoxal 5'-phosphate synthase glutaminase subunit PdxT [Glutamicibacter sp. M10]